VLLLCVAYMPNCATFYFCITWLTTYLKEHHGFDGNELGRLNALPLILSTVTQFLGGFFSDVITKRYGLVAGRRAPASRVTCWRRDSSSRPAPRRSR